MAMNFSVEAILSAVDSNFSKAMNNAAKQVERVSKTAESATKPTQSMFDRIGESSNKASFSIVGLVAKMAALAGGAVALNSAVDRYDTLNNYPKVLSQIGFSAEDSKASIEKLSKGIKGLPTRLDEVASTAQRIAVLTNNLDGATATTLALNNAFLASGSDSAAASRGLEQYVQMLSKGKVDMQSWRTLQETMGVALNDVAKAFGFAGASAQNDLYDALQDGTITFDEFNEKIIEIDGSVNGFAERALTASGGIKTAIKNMYTSVATNLANMLTAIDNALVENNLPNIEGIFLNIRKGIDFAMKGATEAIGPAMKSIIGFVKSLEPYSGIIIAIAAAVASLLIVVKGIMIFNTIAGVIQTLALVMQGATVATTLFQGALVLLSGPIGWIVAGVVALIAILVYLYNTNEDARKIIEPVWQAIKTVISYVIDAIILNIKAFVNIISGAVEFIAGVLTGDWSKAWNGLEKYVKGWSDSVLSLFGTTTDELQGKIGSWASNTGKTIDDWTGGRLSTFSAWWSEVGAGFNNWASDSLSGINGWINDTSGRIVSWAQDASSSFSTWFSDSKSSMDGWFGESKSGFQSWIDETSALLTMWFNNQDVDWDGWWSNTTSGLDSWFSTSKAGFTSWYADTFSGFITWKESTTSGFSSWIEDSKTGIGSWSSETTGKFASWFSSNINAIRVWSSDALNKFKEWKDNVTSIDWLGAGRRLAELIAIGVSNVSSKIGESISGGLSSAYNQVTGWFGTFRNAGANLVGMIADGIRSAVGAVTNAIGSVVGKVRDFLPFSPAKTGPLSDLDKLNFGGTISTGIYAGESQVQRAMSDILEIPSLDFSGIETGGFDGFNSTIGASVTQTINTGNENLIDAFNAYAQKGTNIVLDTGELVGATTDKYDESIGDSAILQERWAF